MALNKATLSTLMKDKLEAIFAWPVHDEAELKKFTDAMADAIISHITSSAVVNASLVNNGIDTGSDTIVTNSVTGGVS